MIISLTASAIPVRQRRPIQKTTKTKSMARDGENENGLEKEKERNESMKRTVNQKKQNFIRLACVQAVFSFSKTVSANQCRILYSISCFVDRLYVLNSDWLH